MDGRTILAEAMRRYAQVTAHDDWQPYVWEAIDAALAQARAEEREACAKMLDHRAKSREKLGAGDALRTENEICAKAIRARRP